MGLDIRLLGEMKTNECACHACGHKHYMTEREVLYACCTTHNLAKMAEAADLYDACWHPEVINAITARDIVGKLCVGLSMLRSCPEEFKRHEAPEKENGSYSQLVLFVENYLKACENNLNAIIQVSR